MSKPIKKSLSLPAVPPAETAQGQQATGEPSTWPDYTPEFRSLTAAEQSSLRNLYRKLYKPVVAQQPMDGALRKKLDTAISNGIDAAIHDVTMPGDPFRYANREIFRFGNYAACMMDIRREVTESVLRALAAQASSDPLDKPRRD